MLLIPQQTGIGAGLEGRVPTAAHTRLLGSPVSRHNVPPEGHTCGPLGAAVASHPHGQGKGQLGHERTEHMVEPRSRVTDGRQHGVLVKDSGPDVQILALPSNHVTLFNSSEPQFLFL